MRDYLRRHENKMAMTGRRLDGFGRCASSREPAGVLTPHTAKAAERKRAVPIGIKKYDFIELRFQMMREILRFNIRGIFLYSES